MNTPKRPSPRLSDAFAFAADGVLRTLVDERNMKIHWVSGAAVMLVGMALPLSVSARAALLFAVLLVLALEVLNAALEGVVNLATESWAFSAKRAKDAAAGTVLLAALGAVFVLADILYHHWGMVTDQGPAIQRTLIAGLPLLGALSVVLAGPRQKSWFICASLGMWLGFLPLAAFSEDPVFSLGCAGLLVGAMLARHREPRLLDQRPPR